MNNFQNFEKIKYDMYFEEILSDEPDFRKAQVHEEKENYNRENSSKNINRNIYTHSYEENNIRFDENYCKLIFL